MLLFPPSYTGTAYIWGVLGWYLLAKALEFHALDHGIFGLGELVSGHTLKHLAASMGALWIVLMLHVRQPLAAPSAISQAR